MRIVAITTLSPSQNVLSTFGFQSVKGFLEIQGIEKIVVLCDKINDESECLHHERLIIDRCWKQNSILNLITLAYKVFLYSPDVIWLNFQYTLFGPSLISSFIGMFLIPVLRLMGYPVLTILHNYYKVIDFDRLGMKKTNILKNLVSFVDPVIMWVILMSNKIFVMSKEYLDDLRSRYPSADVEYVDQDLWEVPSYRSVKSNTKNILVFGVFGTYKKLEPLLDISIVVF